MVSISCDLSWLTAFCRLMDHRSNSRSRGEGAVGGLCGSKTCKKSWACNGFDSRDRVSNCQVARGRRRTCLCEWPYPGARGCCDRRDPVTSSKGKGGRDCRGFLKRWRSGGGDCKTALGGCAREQRRHL